MAFGSFADARSVILNHKDSTSLLLMQPHGDAAPNGIKLDGIADQITPYMGKKGFVSGIFNTIQLNIKFNFFFAPLRFQNQNRLSNLFI